jgi:hypothetical protein
MVAYSYRYRYTISLSPLLNPIVLLPGQSIAGSDGHEPGVELELARVVEAKARAPMFIPKNRPSSKSTYRIFIQDE